MLMVFKYFIQKLLSNGQKLLELKKNKNLDVHFQSTQQQEASCKSQDHRKRETLTVK